VASFYLASGDNPGHDEIDMEFMGNCTGSPVVLSTNGDGRKEQQFGLWFDPAADFHTYAILWNDRNVVFRVDGKVVRVFNRHPDHPYPGGKPMRVHATIWDGSWWATRHGTVPVDWSHAPFVVSYRDYSAVGCTPMGEGKPLACPAGTDRWMKRRPSAADRATLVWARDKHMNYDYCKDGWRFPKGFPAECYRNHNH
jgi:xyloglucan:xyloglucosyl transferase